MNKKHLKPKGFMALMNILIVSSIAIVILTGLTGTLVWENQVIVDSVNADGAYYLAQACTEEGLMRIRRDLNYAWGTILIDEKNECSVEISNLGSDFTLTATGHSYDQNQTIQVEFQITTETNLNTWIDDAEGNNIFVDRNNLNISSWKKI